MFSFLSGISWTYYVIAGLLLALLASGYILNGKIEQVGSLRKEQSLLIQQLSDAEADKVRLSASIEANNKASLEDSKERQELRSKVVVLNKQISSLKKFTKAQSNDSVNKDSDDVLLSDSLRQLLDNAYCTSKGGVCGNTTEPSSKPM